MLRNAFAVCVLIGLANQTNAGLITLAATPTEPELSGFFISFDDTGDGLLQFAEVTSFTGIQFVGKSFPILDQVPTIAGISTISGPIPPIGMCTATLLNAWCFAGPPAFPPTAFDPGGWTYALSSPTPVPTPGPLSLFAGGLIGLGLLRRRKRRANRSI
jgi:hypothetical protein